MSKYLECPICGDTNLWLCVNAKREYNQLPTIASLGGLVVCDQGHEFGYDSLVRQTMRMWPLTTRPTLIRLEKQALMAHQRALRNGPHWLTSRIWRRDKKH